MSSVTVGERRRDKGANEEDPTLWRSNVKPKSFNVEATAASSACNAEGFLH